MSFIICMVILARILRDTLPKISSKSEVLAQYDPKFDNIQKAYGSLKPI